jgi:hypothetical protein
MVDVIYFLSLTSLEKNQIPRYLKLKDVIPLSDSYVASQYEDSDEIIDASYPVYSISQLEELDSTMDVSQISLTSL